MARLPIPGSDDGTWGDILNEYLTIAHASDGTLKSDAVGPTSIQDDSITEAKLASTGGTNGQVLTKNSLATGGIAWTTPASAADATTSSKGIVQLAGDLAGTAAAPTVPGLTNKANNSITITAGTGLTGGGDLTTNRTLSANFGSTSGTIAQGNDSRITGAVQSTIVDAKGDLIVASAADTVARLAVGSNGQVLTADSTQTTGVKWATPSSSGSTNTLFNAMGVVGLTGDPLMFMGGASPSQGDHLIVLVAVPAGVQITGAKVGVQTAGTYSATGTPAQVRFWDFNGALLGTTPDDPSMWLATGARTATLAAPFTSPSNGLLYVGVSFGGFSGASPAIPNNFQAHAPMTGLLGGKRYVIFSNSAAGMPSSFDPTSYGFTTSWAPLLGVTAA